MKELQKKEYEYLRNEINQKVSLHNTLVTFSLTISVTIIAFAYAYENVPHFILLVPYCILLPMAFRVAYYRRAIAKMSAYMIVFLENYEEKDAETMHWETRLKRASELGKAKNRKLRKELRAERKQAALEDVLEKKRMKSRSGDNVKCSRLRVAWKRAGNLVSVLGFPRHFEFLAMGVVCWILYMISFWPGRDNTSCKEWGMLVFSIFLVVLLFIVTIDMMSTNLHKQMWIKRWQSIDQNE